MRAPQLINYAVNRLSYNMVSTNTFQIGYVMSLINIMRWFRVEIPIIKIEETTNSLNAFQEIAFD